ncbi:hypothetical protein EAH88_14435 [Rhodanobacter glycinis]|uniref:Transmembrane protein n=1 Tax=Rhodanobacter glycinis TaxID=582702 RepID=A0A502BZ54_9GAMM|nr:hypothetical protein [Rhodanobacter glycinis]TPG06515.1 hypothetical protein EAH88_14435 [Rhodanobacter glycinis]
MSLRAVHKRYLREFIPAMSAYVMLILLYGVLMPRTESLPLRVLLAVLPLLPIMLVIRAIVRVIRDQDELERRIDLEAIAIAAMATGFGYFSFGFLLNAGIGLKVAPAAVAIWVMPCLFGTFGLAKLLVARRYRSHE